MRTQNLHNHTLFSDGAFLPEELIRRAIDTGIEVLGISDHFYTTKIYEQTDYDTWINSWWPRYVYSIACLKEYFADEIELLAAVEIDSSPGRTVGDLSRLPWNDFTQKLDYILFEYVGEDCVGGLPFEQIGNLREHYEKDIILAHANLDYLHQTIGIENFIAALKRYDLTLEIPAGRRNQWYWEQFDPALLQGVKLSIGSDTHRAIEEVANIRRAWSFLKCNNLVENLIYSCD
jgi:histidinol phosphatase-like PHP family hydrolase